MYGVSRIWTGDGGASGSCRPHLSLRHRLLYTKSTELRTFYHATYPALTDQTPLGPLHSSRRRNPSPPIESSLIHPSQTFQACLALFLNLSNLAASRRTGIQDASGFTPDGVYLTASFAYLYLVLRPDYACWLGCPPPAWFQPLCLSPSTLLSYSPRTTCPTPSTQN